MRAENDTRCLSPESCQGQFFKTVISASGRLAHCVGRGTAEQFPDVGVCIKMRIRIGPAFITG